jgi:hypothetical protein
MECERGREFSTQRTQRVAEERKELKGQITEFRFQVRDSDFEIHSLSLFLCDPLRPLRLIFGHI